MKEIFTINGYLLDDNQQRAVLSDDKNTLIVAGAGTGKTLTLVGKIRYLIEVKQIKENEILCISFTNDSTKSLFEKIKKDYNYNIEVLTFHKLGIKILKDIECNYSIASDSTLKYVIDEYFNSYVLNKKILIKHIYNYLSITISYKRYNNSLNIYKEQYTNFKLLIEKFINLYKGKYNTDQEFKNFFQKTNSKTYSFLIIAYSIYKIYENELNSQYKLDFNNMINLASEAITNNKIKYKYKYILVDEYQDTSYTRYKLIKALVDKLNCKLICVGDDFQSIYRFTGCDIDIFVNFEKYYGLTNIVRLENTYRNCQELLNIAGTFITKNPNQIKKTLKSNKSIEKPIEIICSKDYKKTFETLINNIFESTNKPIMIIGRNNFDIYNYLNNEFVLKEEGVIEYKNNKNINLRFLTAHKSKGLEEENVILINCINNLYGFPSKLENEKIIDLVVNTKDKYKYEEERRLFYVAMTRTKNKVYIITEKYNESIFVKELIRENKVNINIINDIKKHR